VVSRIAALTYLTVPVNVRSGYADTEKVTRLPSLTGRHVGLGHGQLEPQGIDLDERDHLRVLADVLADVDVALADDAAERCAHDAVAHDERRSLGRERRSGDPKAA